MKCPKCHTDNPDTSRFCGICATSLTQAGEQGVSVTKTIETTTDEFTRGKIFAGRYEIIEELGHGGMGEVYKARDTRLGRTVAIKVLPSGAAADPDRRRRFEQEARAASALNHPHICVLHDVGRDGDIDYLVMELLEGQSLAERLARGPLALDEALQVGIDIADALAVAHRQGIIHRDLKPGNVIQTKSGAKLLDFGLAKLITPRGAGVAVQSSFPTQTSPATEKGMILGTLAYMAPEQLEGKDADARSDLFSFGAMLYEMLTGRRAFEGTSPASVISAVMTSQPAPLSSLQPLAPPALDRLVRQCLEKDPDARWQSVHDLATTLSWIMERDEPGTVTSPVYPLTRRRALVGLATAAILFAVLAALGWLRPHGGSDVRQTLHLPISVKNPPRVVNLWGAALALSRDGTKIVYRTSQGWQLLDLATGTSREVTTEWQGNHATFSPRGDTLLIRAGGWFGQLVKISLSTGNARVLLSPVTGGEMQWADDGWIYFGRELGIARVREEGGTVENLCVPDPTRDNWIAVNPVPLPGGRSVIFTRRQRPLWDHSRDEICVLDLGSKTVRLLMKGQQAWYVAAGYLLVVQPGGAVFAVPLDKSGQELAGEAIKVLDGVATLGTMYGSAVLTVADNGTLVYVTRTASEGDELVVVDRTGAIERAITGWDGWIQAGGLSFDGKRIVASLYRDFGVPNIWLRDLSTSQPVRISYGEILDFDPQFMPDDRNVAYVSPREGGNWRLYTTSAGGGAEERNLLGRPGDIRTPSFTAGGWIVFCESDLNGQDDVVAHRMGTDTTVKLAATPANENMPTASPDARWVAYQSDELGRNEVYVQQLQKEGKAQQVSAQGGSAPWWSRSGHELFYINGKDQVVSVRFDAIGSREGKDEQVLFPLGDLIWARMVLPSDQGFVMIRHKMTGASGEVVLVRNWFEELKRLVPTGKK
jgi:serine/threonine-protein kinase